MSVCNSSQVFLFFQQENESLMYVAALAAGDLFPPDYVDLLWGEGGVTVSLLYAL